MGSKKVWFGLLLGLLGVAALWLLRPLSDANSVDYKELYREAFHTQAADMEARQRNRWNDQTS